MNYEKFLSLNKTKQDKIINAFCEVVATHGYNQAPTDLICQKAGISKGALFHYFGTKEGLFVFAFKYVADMVYTSVKFDENKKEDCFDALLKLTLEKLELIKIYPYMMNFMIRVIKENLMILEKHNLLNLMKYVQDSQNYIMTHLDFSHLKEGISPLDVISWFTMVSKGFIDLYIESNQKELLTDQLIHLFKTMKTYFTTS